MFFRRWHVAPAVLGILAGVSCGESPTTTRANPDPPPAPPTQPPAPPPTTLTVTVNQATLQFTALGDTDSLSASVRNSAGAVVDSAVTWTSTNVGVVSVDPAGLVEAKGPGAASIVATVGSASATTDVNVHQEATGLRIVEGDGQTGTVAEVLPISLTVQPIDRNGHGIGRAGIQTSFSVTDGGGTLSTAGVPTEANGHASVGWTLGTVATAEGGVHQVDAVLGSSPESLVHFKATAVAGPAAQIQMHDGDMQWSHPGHTLPNQLKVRVVDAYQNGVHGLDVPFEMTSGTGTVSPANPTTGPTGIATTVWRLGPEPPVKGVGFRHETVEARLPDASIEFVAEVVRQPGGDTNNQMVVGQFYAFGASSGGWGGGFDPDSTMNAVIVNGVPAHGIRILSFSVAPISGLVAYGDIGFIVPMAACVGWPTSFLPGGGLPKVDVVFRVRGSIVQTVQESAAPYTGPCP